MEDVPRYRASRSDRRSPDRESAAHDHLENVSLLKLARIISQDQTFLAIGRDAAWRYASPPKETLGPTPDDDAVDDRPENDLPQNDLPELDCDDSVIDPRRGRSPEDEDDRGGRQGRTIRARHFTSNDDEPTRLPQFGHGFSELTRLVGRIDSFLAAGSTRTGRFEQTTGGGRPVASDEVDEDAVGDDEAQDIEMPVPSRHDRLTNDTDDPGLSLYAPRRKRRAAFVIARTDQPKNLHNGGRPATEERPSAVRDRARNYAPRQSDRGDDYYTRPQQRRGPPVETVPRRRSGRFLTATAVLAFAATAALYGYRTWADAGSNHPGPIAAEAAPVTATGDSVDAPTVDASTHSGIGESASGVWSDLTTLLAPGTTLNGGTNPPRTVTGESTTAATARPQRHDEERAHRSPAARVGAHVGNIVPIANAGVSASTNAVLPCEVGATRSSC
jgi:hypothetical protein